jgi:hypothetical protein
MNNNCISYNPSTIEIFIPSPIIFYTLCVSTDKTSLFLISLIRLIIYVLIYYCLNDIIDYNVYQSLQYTLISIICINIIYIGLVVSKNTLFSIGNGRSMFEQTIGKST